MHYAYHFPSWKFQPTIFIRQALFSLVDYLATAYIPRDRLWASNGRQQMSLKWLIINVVNRHVVDGLMLSKPLHNLSIRTDWTIECHFKWSKKHRKLRGDNTENSQYITKNADCIGLRSVEIMKRKSGLKNKKWPLNGSKRTGNDVEGEKKRKSNRPRYGGFTLHKNEIKTMPNESNGTVGK